MKTYEGKIPEMIKVDEETLQRTAEWFEKRRGRFTGSKIKDLMSCSRSTAKIEWGRPEKLIDFGEKAKEYIYTKAKERQRGYAVQTPTTAAMSYGTENEDAVIELLPFDVEKCDFMEIEGLEGIAGASPDGRYEDQNVEIKCATTWEQFYKRVELPFDQTHMDFWQVQTEMMAQKLNKTMYIVAEPSESIFEPNITSFTMRNTQASEIHQKAIYQRCEIGDEAIKLFLKGYSIHQAIQQACTEYEIKE